MFDINKNWQRIRKVTCWVRTPKNPPPAAECWLVFQITQKVFCQNVSPLAVDSTRGVETKSAKFFVVLSLHSKKKKNLQEIHHITQSELGCQFNKHIQNLWQFRCKRLLIFSKDIACCKLSDYLILMSLPIMIPFCTGLRGRSTRRIRFYRISENHCAGQAAVENAIIFLWSYMQVYLFPPQLENSI